MIPFMSCAASPVADNSPQTVVDAGRFLGRWYEIARYDHVFERGMRGTQAEYALNGDGTMAVTNSGWRNGKFQNRSGVAKWPDPENAPGHLRVSFFKPFYSDYRILKVNEDYSYAVIGGSSDKYLWILSRTPLLEDDVVSGILDEIETRGYDTSRLLWVDQSINFNDDNYEREPLSMLCMWIYL